MKKIISVLMVAVMLFAVSAVAVSASDFVPSVGEETTAPVVPGLGIVITPFDKVNEADDIADAEGLKAAYDSLKNAGNLANLAVGVLSGSTVRDLYDIAFVDGNGGEVALNANLTDDNFQVLFFDGTSWKVIEAKRNSDGSVTIKLDKPGQVAILVNEGKPAAPQTSDAFVAALVCMTVAGMALTAVVARRRRSN